MAIQTSAALAQFALLGAVLLPKAQTKSMINPTIGMAMRSMVIIQSPKLTGSFALAVAGGVVGGVLCGAVWSSINPPNGLTGNNTK